VLQKLQHTLTKFNMMVSKKLKIKKLKITAVLRRQTVIEHSTQDGFKNLQFNKKNFCQFG